MRFFFSWQNSLSCCAKLDLPRISRSDCQIIGDGQNPLPTTVARLLKNFEFHIQLGFDFTDDICMREGGFAEKKKEEEPKYSIKGLKMASVLYLSKNLPRCPICSQCLTVPYVSQSNILDVASLSFVNWFLK